MAFLLAMGLLPSQFDNDGDVPQQSPELDTRALCNIFRRKS
jgi:hypothetical protein